MTKNPEIVGSFAEVIDAPGFTGRLWFAALIGMTVIGCVCGLSLLGAAVMAGSRGVGGRIVDFSLQNAATVQSATQYIRFNQIFAEGDLPQGRSLSAVVGTQTVPLQMDVLSRYDDGSVKSAILTIAAPAIAAGATLKGSLAASDAAAKPSHREQCGARAGLRPHGQHEHRGLRRGDDQCRAAARRRRGPQRFQMLRKGALATEIRFDVAVIRALRVTFDVVTYADGSISTKVWFQNDAAMGAAGGAILFNSLSIVERGTTRFSTTNLTQYQYQVWAQDVTEDSSAKQTLNVRHDIDYLEQTGAIWNYDLTATVGAAPSVPSSWTNVLGVNGLVPIHADHRRTAGHRPDHRGECTLADHAGCLRRDLRPCPGAGRGQHSLALLRHRERPLPLGRGLSQAVDRPARQRPALADSPMTNRAGPPTARTAPTSPTSPGC